MQNLTLDAFKPSPRLKRNGISDPILAVHAALVKDLDTETELYRFEKDRLRPLASLTKILSAVVANEDVGFDKKVVISESALQTEGAAGDLAPGEIYRVGELVKAMMSVSSNDAATAISEFFGAAQFVEAMNRKAKLIGMFDSNFVDPTGISSRNQSTLDDLEKLVKYAREYHPGIFKVTAQPLLTIFEESRGVEKELKGINLFAGREDFLGGKTGFTDEAGGNLVSLFLHEGHNLLIIVLGTDDRFGETEKLYNWIKDSYLFN